MENQANKPAKKKRFFKNVHGKKRILLFTGIYFSLFLVLFIVSAEITSKPSFCPTCHYMEPFHQSWRTSGHNKIECIECHMEPGVAGMIKGKVNGLVMVVNYVTQSYRNRKPWAEIPDNTCTRSECHETQGIKDTTYIFKSVPFNHKNHLGEQRRGKTLKCTSCHSQIVQGTHIKVTTSTCYNCHINKSDVTENVSAKLFDCNTCHDVKLLSGVQAVNFRYDHSIVSEKQISCIRCHSNVASGDGRVEKERCIQCHFEFTRLDKFEKVDTVHTIHIQDHNVPCYYCHTKIEHAIQKSNPDFSQECSKCHSAPHSPSYSLYRGEDGFNTEKTPSAMFNKGINCDGCHQTHGADKKGKGFVKTGDNSCETCHSKGFDNLLKQWENAASVHISEINSIHLKASSLINSSPGPKKEEAVKLLVQAEYNIDLVRSGKSVHNILYTDKLLRASYELMNRALSITGVSYKLPEYVSSSQFVPNECYSCHTGVEHLSKKVFDLNFSHEKHIISNKITCSKCHSNAVKHGELIINKQNCNSCHHANVNVDDDCAKCHQLQVKMFSGTYMNKGLPDYMKSGGVKCIDCHVSQFKVIKPGLDVCIKCHSNDYKEMAKDWENEFKKMLSEIAGLVNNIPESRLNDEQRASLKETRQLLNDLKLYRSIFVHNHELISSVLSDKLKFLKGIQFSVK